ncbi:MAG: metal ABC transporter ATP-binding protein [Negativicutes bacterium]|nr:metal ABC transporter ATP-binding protein [Negativicutes bacterium]
MCNIDVTGLSFAYRGRPVLTDINLKVDKGSFVVILGPNGSGKSTLIKLVAGLLEPQQGTVHLDGLSPQTYRKQGLMGYVPQNYGNNTAAFPATVEEVVRLGVIAQQPRVSRTAARHIVDHMLSFVGIAELRHRRISDLSGGQQQRVMVARALAGNPRLLLLDEPTSGIDMEASARIYELLASLNHNLGITVLMVSHDIGKATQYASQVACINNGLCYFGDSKHFRSHYKESPHSWYYGA